MLNVNKRFWIDLINVCSKLLIICTFELESNANKAFSIEIITGITFAIVGYRCPCNIFVVQQNLIIRRKLQINLYFSLINNKIRICSL